MSNSQDAKIALARQHVEGGRRIVAAQQAVVDKIGADGGDTAEAEEILDSFRRKQASFEVLLSQLVAAQCKASITPSCEVAQVSQEALFRLAMMRSLIKRNLDAVTRSQAAIDESRAVLTQQSDRLLSRAILPV